jgi:hypothetical protein
MTASGWPVSKHTVPRTRGGCGWPNWGSAAGLCRQLRTGSNAPPYCAPVVVVARAAAGHQGMSLSANRPLFRSIVQAQGVGPVGGGLYAAA